MSDEKVAEQNPKTMFASREKYWEEMTDSQKIDALREAVVWLARDFAAVERGVADLACHQHAPDGRLMVAMPHPGAGMNLAGGYTADLARRLKTPRERRD